MIRAAETNSQFSTKTVTKFEKPSYLMVHKTRQVAPQKPRFISMHSTVAGHRPPTLSGTGYQFFVRFPSSQYWSDEISHLASYNKLVILAKCSRYSLSLGMR